MSVTPETIDAINRSLEAILAITKSHGAQIDALRSASVLLATALAEQKSVDAVALAKAFGQLVESHVSAADQVPMILLDLNAAIRVVADRPKGKKR